MQVPFLRPDITEAEIEAVADTMRSGWITTGPKTKEFEHKLAQLCNTEYFACTNSATGALECALRLLGVGPGDEVITSAYTYTASCSVIVHCGATPVLVDTAKDSLEMDYEALASAITERTKAIIPVDIAGIMCNYDKVFDVVEAQKSKFKPANNLQSAIGRVVVVADAAHSLGATYHNSPSGSVADFSAFSFHAVKNLTTGEGGGLTWRSNLGFDGAELYRQTQLKCLHGQNKSALAKTQLGSWEYDIEEPAYKWNLTDIASAIGLAQLQRYPQMLARRQQILQMYSDGLNNKGVHVYPHYIDNNHSSGHLAITRVDNITEQQRNDIIVKMAEAGVTCNVHYKPLPMMTAYERLGFDIANYPASYDFYRNEITLPLFTLLTDEQVEYVINTYLQAIAEVGL